MSKGITAVMDGFDGCLAPFAWFLFALIASPCVAGVAVVVIARAGIEGAATPEFVREVVWWLLGIAALAVVALPLAAFAVARAMGSRPIIAHPAPSPISVRMNGMIDAAPPPAASVEPMPHSLADIPLLVDTHEGGR